LMKFIEGYLTKALLFHDTNYTLTYCECRYLAVSQLVATI
jgi:hypothetical protein